MKKELLAALLVAPLASNAYAFLDAEDSALVLPRPAISAAAAPAALSASGIPLAPSAPAMPAPAAAAPQPGLRAKAASLWQRLRGKTADVRRAQDEGKDPKASLDAAFSGSSPAFAVFDIGGGTTYRRRDLPGRTVEQFWTTENGQERLVEQRLSEKSQGDGIDKVSRFSRGEDGKLRIESEDLAQKGVHDYHDSEGDFGGSTSSARYYPSKDSPLRVIHEAEMRLEANFIHWESRRKRDTHIYFRGQKVLTEHRTSYSGLFSTPEPKPEHAWLDGQGRPIDPR